MNAQSQKTVANCAELKIHIYECRKEPYLAAFYALALNLGYGFFCGLLLFLINLSGSRVLSFAVLSAQHIISYLIRFKYLPFFISVFSNHGFSEDAGLPSVGFSICCRISPCLCSYGRSACYRLSAASGEHFSLFLPKPLAALNTAGSLISSASSAISEHFLRDSFSVWRARPSIPRRCRISSCRARRAFSNGG